ncbi:NepR family anti-sigma factor [Sphingomonas sp.]|uniref:NepR family anti-sigma factor n=1 Tax=Sphingomonas sp. TaxID=28214 RepID=UPI003B00C620
MADRTDKISQPGGGPRGPSRRTSDKLPEDPQVGAALRSVYQKAVEEDVPDEMLALLSKLG